MPFQTCGRGWCERGEDLFQPERFGRLLLLPVVHHPLGHICSHHGVPLWYVGSIGGSWGGGVAMRGHGGDVFRLTGVVGAGVIGWVSWSLLDAGHGGFR